MTAKTSEMVAAELVADRRSTTFFELVDLVYASQVEEGLWDDEQNSKDTDWTRLFMDLHAKVNAAYTTYSESGASDEIVWIDPMTGAVASPDSGIPIGLAVDLMQVAMLILGFARHLKIDSGRVLELMIAADRKRRSEELEEVGLEGIDLGTLES